MRLVELEEALGEDERLTDRERRLAGMVGEPDERAFGLISSRRRRDHSGQIRTCEVEGCGTILSRYNRGGFCSLHG